MRLKSYFAGSVEEAIEKARVELGPEAMLLNSKKIAPEQSGLGDYEVVFGVTEEPLLRKGKGAKPSAQLLPPKTGSHGVVGTPFVAPIVEANAPAANAAAAEGAQSSALAQELAELRKQIEGVKHLLSATAQGEVRGTGRRKPSSDLASLQSQLAAFDFSNELTDELIFAAKNRELSGSEPAPKGRKSGGSGSLQRALLAELYERITVRPEVGRPGCERQVVMLVGPPGAGKTTTIAKLAVRLGLERGIPVHLVSLDTVRVGGSEQLRTYARVLGVSFDAVYTVDALSEILEEHGGRKLILIDSPGYAPAETAEADQVARFLEDCPEIEVQLVLPAYLRASALGKFAERFSSFGPEKLLFTHLDEVDTAGPLIEHAVRSALPISFLANGQSITDDLQDATKGRLTEGMFNLHAARTAAA